MNKLIVGIFSAALLFTTSANADNHRRERDRDYRVERNYYPDRGHREHRRHHNDWIAPAIGGIIVGAVIANSRAPQVVQVPPSRVEVMPPPPPTPRYVDCYVDVYDPVYRVYRREYRVCTVYN